MAGPTMKRSSPWSTRCLAVGLALWAIAASTGCASAERARPRVPRATLSPYDEAEGERAAAEVFSAMQAAQVRISMVIAQALSWGANLWILTNGDCPTTADIVHAQLVAESFKPEDAWGNGYRIECTGGDDGDPIVTSPGPDGVFGTEDDIVVGKGATAFLSDGQSGHAAWSRPKGRVSR